MKIHNQRSHLIKLFTIPKHELNDVAKKWIAKRKTADISLATLRNSEQWYRRFRRFLYQYNKRDVVLDNKLFGKDYVDWMIKEKLGNTYIKKHLVIFLIFLNAIEIVHGLSVKILLKNCVKAEKVDDDVWLTKKEIKQLLNLKWKDQRESLILDRFIIACFTGCRRSEIDNLEIVDDKTLQYHTSKNKKTIKIPFINELRPYLVDDDFKYSSGILNTKDHIKESETLTKIFKHLGWNQMVKKYRLVGSKKTMYKVPRHTAIRFHAARKWYGKMLLDMDVPMYKVSQLLGHSSIVLTQSTYASISRDKMIDDVNDLINTKF